MTQYDPEIKARCIRLRRRKRMTLDKIQEKTGVSKGTLSVWLRSYPLTPEERLKSRALSPAQIVKRFQKCGLALLEPYKNQRTKVRARCLVCAYEWKTTPNSVHQGNGCPKCGGTLPLTQAQVDTRFRKQRLKLLGIYKNLHTKVRTRCLTCGYEWWPCPSDIGQGRGCPKCATQAKRLTQEEVIIRYQKLKLELLEPYRNSETKIRTRCLVCGYEWESRIRRGRGCPCCSSLMGKTEQKIRAVIELITGWKFPRSRPVWLKGRSRVPMELDGYNEEHKVAFEYQGQQHYRPVYGAEALASLKQNDNRKRSLCYYHGVLLIRVPWWKRNVREFLVAKLQEKGKVK